MSAAGRIRELIEREGPIPFARFMDIALYEPACGYYAAGMARVGKAGDFVTSVSPGPAYGRVLAMVFESLCKALGDPETFTIVEQGANDATLAADVLAGAEPEFLKKIRYWIVEPLANLKDVQRSVLKSWQSQVTWFDSLADLPEWEGVHFSNELVDAMPFHIVVSTGGGWQELHVGLEGGGFGFVEKPLSPEAAREANHFPDRPAGYLTEVRPLGGEWICQVAAKLRKGFVLTMDYGFSEQDLLREDRNRGTFRAYKDHRMEEDVLSEPGEKDLTSHVDFSSLARHGRDAGLKPVGFCDQHHFLVAAAEPLLRKLEGARPGSEDFRTLQNLKTLLHPEAMGTRFHAFCMSAGFSTPPEIPAFRFGKTGFTRL